MFGVLLRSRGDEHVVGSGYLAGSIQTALFNQHIVICRNYAEISHVLCYHLGDFRLEESIGKLNLPLC